MRGIVPILRRACVTAALFAAIPLGARAARASDDDCNPVRLDAPGGSMEHVAPRDQGMLNICYAYPGAELTDAWRFTHGAQPPPGGYGHQTSAAIAAIGLSHALGEKAKWDTGRSSQQIFDYLKTANSCSESDVFANPNLGVAARQNAYMGLLNSAWTQMTHYFNDRERVRQIFDDLEARHADPQEVEYEAFYKYGAFPIADDLTCKLRRQLNMPADLIPTKLFRGSNLAIANMLLYGDRVRYFYDYFQQACAKYTVPITPKLPDYEGDFVKPDGGPGATRKIKRRLDRNPSMPVVVNMCAWMLTKPNYHGYTIGHDDKVQCQDDGYHSVLVIGKRRKPDGTCQLLVRNSWGLGCFQYRKRYTPPPADNDYTWHDPNCEGDKGQLWVDEKDFWGNVYEVGYLDD